MNKDINETINLLNGVMNHEDNKLSFDTYQRTYAVTNENLNDLFLNVDLSNINNALTVTSSGDQIFNLVTNGVLNIDSFDSNITTSYYALGLKKSAILKYNYHDYLIFLKKIFNPNTSIEELSQLLTDLIPYMDKEYKEYWKQLISFGYKNNVNIMTLLCFNIRDLENNSEKNNYLIDKESYNELKNNLHKSNITFKHIDYYDISTLNKKYDLLYFSNIPDYFYRKYDYFWYYKSLEEEYKKLSNISSQDSQIIMSYLYNCYHSSGMNNNILYLSNVRLEDLKDEEIILFDSIVKNKKLSNIKDGALIKRK